MKLLLIGSGGREHSLAIQLKKSPKCSQLFIAPGNPGTAKIGQNIPIPVTDLSALLNFAKSEGIDLTIVGPEAPLVEGIVDKFEQAGLAIIGPTQKGAQLEGSKAFSKAVMKKAGIPTADSQVFTDYGEAVDYLNAKNAYPIVVKADGLAAGKGVVVALDFVQADAALRNCMLDKAFKAAGTTVVIEDFLQGEEASILAFSDGKTIVPMVSAQDHKPVGEGDTGPNTGGMGAYSPVPVVTGVVAERVQTQILEPMLAALRQEGIVYKGILYAGLMIHNEEPSVVEFNVRFGDPETQAVLPRLKTDLLDIFLAIRDQDLSDIHIEWDSGAACCVVLAAKGYPGAYPKGDIIQGIDDCDDIRGCHVIQAGTSLNEDQELVTSGGRVMAVVGQSSNLGDAIKTAYDGVEKIQFTTKYYRKDIGAKALSRV